MSSREVTHTVDCMVGQAVFKSQIYEEKTAQGVTLRQGGTFSQFSCQAPELPKVELLEVLRLALS